MLNVTTTESQGARLVLDDPLPAGFEIDNPHILASGDVAALDWLNPVSDVAHVEFRADRFIAAWDLPTGGATEFQFAYIVRATSPGTFLHPGGADRGHVPARAPRPHRYRHGRGGRAAAVSAVPQMEPHQPPSC